MFFCHTTSFPGNFLSNPDFNDDFVGDNLAFILGKLCLTRGLAHDGG
jgi:hypothetical protein